MDSLRNTISSNNKSQPTAPQSYNEAVLYSVLERANLAQYFNDFIAQGGDDVFQLCEAGEDEFLEIMALVGMASKPLHVRRLQKALQEWALFPDRFKPSPMPSSKNNVRSCAFPIENGKASHDYSLLRSLITQPMVDLPSSHLLSQNHNRLDNKSTSPSSELSDPDVNSFQNDALLYPPCGKLSDLQIQAIERTVDDRVTQLPSYPPKPLNMKKPIDREIEEVMLFPPDDKSRLEVFRKYGAIYGRFDSKRNKNKQLNFHEMCVNEAAAQLCLHRPSLITRREDLFFQARQVVKEAGFQLTRVQYRSKEYPLGQSSEDNEPPLKLPRIELSKDAETNSESSTYQINNRLSNGSPSSLLKSVLSSGKRNGSSSNGAHFLPSSLLLPSPGENEDVSLTLAGDGEMSLVEEGLRIARQYGLNTFGEIKSTKTDHNSMIRHLLV